LEAAGLGTSDLTLPWICRRDRTDKSNNWPATKQIRLAMSFLQDLTTPAEQIDTHSTVNTLRVTWMEFHQAGH
jgi:hypothetical protein